MMKPNPLLLAGVLSVTLCACGDGAAQQEPLAVGETAGTDEVEFVLERCEFTDALDAAVYLGEEFSSYDMDNHMMPVREGTTSTSFYGPSEGNVLISVTYRVKNVGKETHQDYPTLTVDYNNGYTYDSDNFYCRLYEGSGNNEWGQICSPYYGHSLGLDGKPMDLTVLDMQPLGDEKVIRGYFDVPAELQEKEENSLCMNVVMKDSSGKDAVFTYNLRG